MGEPSRDLVRVVCGETATNQNTFDDGNAFSEQDDDFGGFNSFDSIAPSGGSVPKAQTHVS